METVKLELNIAESILLSLKEDKETFKNTLIYYTSLMLYRKGRLSLGKAAEFAGFTRLDFIQKLQEEDEYIFDYDKKMIDEMITKAKEISRIL